MHIIILLCYMYDAFYICLYLKLFFLCGSSYSVRTALALIAVTTSCVHGLNDGMPVCLNIWSVWKWFKRFLCIYMLKVSR